MNSSDFTKLLGLLSKLNNATTHVAEVDGSFQKHYAQTIDQLKLANDHIKKIEQGLAAAKFIQYEET